MKLISIFKVFLSLFNFFPALIIDTLIPILLFLVVLGIKRMVIQ